MTTSISSKVIKKTECPKKKDKQKSGQTYKMSYNISVE